MLQIKKTEIDAQIPTRATKQAAGADLKATKDYVIPAWGKALVGTGIAIRPPTGTFGQVTGKSGLALHNNIMITGGVIDSDYRGEIGVIAFNLTNQDFILKKGEAIAQLICIKIAIPEIVEVGELDATERGEKGFGSSGV